MLTIFLLCYPFPVLKKRIDIYILLKWWVSSLKVPCQGSAKANNVSLLYSRFCSFIIFCSFWRISRQNHIDLQIKCQNSIHYVIIIPLFLQNFNIIFQKISSFSCTYLLVIYISVYFYLFCNRYICLQLVHNNIIYNFIFS